MTYANFVEDLKYRLIEYNDSFKSEEENRYPKKTKGDLGAQWTLSGDHSKHLWL